MENFIQRKVYCIFNFNRIDIIVYMVPHLCTYNSTAMRYLLLLVFTAHRPTKRFSWFHTSVYYELVP